jgi:hypothetical protein
VNAAEVPCDETGPAISWPLPSGARLTGRVGGRVGWRCAFGHEGVGVLALAVGATPDPPVEINE